MALGTVEINQQNLGNGALAEVERTWLFIGTGSVAANHNTLFSITPQTDLTATFGANSNLTRHLSAAIANANTTNFFAYALSLEDPLVTYQDAVLALMDKPTDLDVEAIALLAPVNALSAVTSAETFVATVASTYAKQISMHLTTDPIDPETQTWTSYIAALKAIISGAACPHVAVVPDLHGNNLGVVAGRLCNPAVTIGDSPMRVATGALIGLGTTPVDSNDDPLAQAHIAELSRARFSVPQWYTGFDGMYWGDHMMLDAEGGDFQVYEYLRCVQAAARRVRILAIRKIADRSLNSSAKSIAFHINYFEKPLREMAKSTIINGLEFPGAIQNPIAGDITISWTSLTAVTIVLIVAPVACPKRITCYIALDLNRY